MWKKMTWAEAKARKLFIVDCWDGDKTYPSWDTQREKNETLVPCDCPAGQHDFCAAWVEEVTLPRVVVEWTEKDITYRLVQTTGSTLSIECQAYKEDLMGFKQPYWEFWTNPASGMGSGLIAALVEKLDGVGQK